jgi:hypothetical protein
VSKAGFRVVLSGDEIETAEISRSLAAAWSRQRRWAILRKRLGRISYATELLASPLPWFAGTLLAAHGDAALIACAGSLYLLRIALEARAAQQSGCFRGSDLLLAPVKDLAVAALFWAGLFGRRTSWRGRTLVVGRETLIGQPAGAGGLSGLPHQAAETG